MVVEPEPQSKVSEEWVRESHNSITLVYSRYQRNFWEWIFHLGKSSQKYEKVLVGIFYPSLEEEARIAEYPNFTFVILSGAGSRAPLPNAVRLSNLHDFITTYSDIASTYIRKEKALHVLAGCSLLAALHSENTAISLVKDISSNIYGEDGEVCIHINPVLSSEVLKNRLERICDRYIDLDEDTHKIP